MNRFNSWTEVYLYATQPYTREELGRKVALNAFLREVDKNTVSLDIDGKQAAVFRSDNTVEFFRMYRLQNIWYGRLWLSRTDKDQYRVYMVPKWRKAEKTDPLFYPGIKFDLASGACLNPLPDPVKVDVPEVSGPWRTKVRNYQRAWRVLAKCGALNVDNAKYLIRSYHTFDLKEFLRMVEEVDVGQQAIENVLSWSRSKYRWQWYYTPPKDLDLERQFNSVYNSHRDEVREAVGCFKWEGKLPELLP